MRSTHSDDASPSIPISLVDAFLDGQILRDTLPSRPRVCWSVSAGHDTRPLVFFSDPMREATIRLAGMTPAEFLRPDLFIYTCLDEGGQGLHDLQEGQVLFEDRSTRATVEARHPLCIDRVQVPYAIDRSRVHFGEDPLDRHDHDAALIRVRLTCLRTGHEETATLLYLAMENLQAWDALISRADIRLDALVATREGLGFGGCGRSILEHLYQDGRILEAQSPFQVPRFVVTWGDHTDEVFLRSAPRYHPGLRKVAPYIHERGVPISHQIYQLDPPRRIGERRHLGRRMRTAPTRTLRPA